MIVYTETGSRYQFDESGHHVRRLANPDSMLPPLRRDGDWIRLRSHPHFEHDVDGSRLVMVLEPLGVGDFTVRTTSLVTRVEDPLPGLLEATA